MRCISDFSQCGAFGARNAFSSSVNPSAEIEEIGDREGADYENVIAQEQKANTGIAATHFLSTGSLARPVEPGSRVARPAAVVPA